MIEVPDLDAAIGWAEKCPVALYRAVEILPSALICRDGHGQTAVDGALTS
ncbi:hypothetical protein [Cryobacterium sp. Y11]|nr:hypothetical protein [Cryobacterium sp. Y11]